MWQKIHSFVLPNQINCFKYYCTAFNLKKFPLPSRYSRKKSVFLEYGDLAAKYKPINLGMGFPDFGAPKWITQILVDIAKDKDPKLQMCTRSSVSKQGALQKL